MKEKFVTDAEIRQFLLGSVDDLERQRIEGLFMSDAEFNQRVLIAEDELIEDYLEQSLAPKDSDKFLTQYGHAPEQQRRLRISRSIKDYAASEARLGQTPPEIVKRRVFLSHVTPRNLRFFIPIAAAITIACIIGVVWLVRSNNRHVAIERELAELNAQPDLRVNPSQVVSLVLPPVSIRSVGPETTLTPRADISVVELDLLWIQKERYPNYQVLVRRVGTNEEFGVSGLHIEARPTIGNSIRVRLPSDLLRDGLYQVTLTGAGPDGVASQGEEYTFVVAR
ncbi:MAG: hypothetical protein QOH41_1500 [Blastocatellia bacterium]|jgi:hypothetical protein|nr:hypothetical protein [Blastocatellia bacterium]